MPVKDVAALPLSLLKGIDQARDVLHQNTRRFADGLPANNALLWGARGMGKSSLVKAVHAEVNKGRAAAKRLALLEIPREDIASLPHLLRRLRGIDRRFLLFCDDLSFDRDDTSYKSLKAALEGGVEGRPSNVLFYATSNRRHMMPRDMMENERSTAINPSEAVEEKVSLSDRFGLWLGLPPLRAGRISRDDRGLCRAFQTEAARRRVARARDCMVGRARRTLGPRRLAVHSGLSGGPRQDARLNLRRFRRDEIGRRIDRLACRAAARNAVAAG